MKIYERGRLATTLPIPLRRREQLLAEGAAVERVLFLRHQLRDLLAVDARADLILRRLRLGYVAVTIRYDSVTARRSATASGRHASLAPSKPPAHVTVVTAVPSPSKTPTRRRTFFSPIRSPTYATCTLRMWRAAHLLIFDPLDLRRLEEGGQLRDGLVRYAAHVEWQSDDLVDVLVPKQWRDGIRRGPLLCRHYAVTIPLLCRYHAVTRRCYRAVTMYRYPGALLCRYCAVTWCQEGEAELCRYCAVTWCRKDRQSSTSEVICRNSAEMRMERTEDDSIEGGFDGWCMYLPHVPSRL